MGDMLTLRRNGGSAQSVSVSAAHAAGQEDANARVVDFNAFKARKSMTGDRKAGLNSTFRVGSADSPGATHSTDDDLATRIERIKSSINRINALMSELRTASEPNKARD